MDSDLKTLTERLAHVEKEVTSIRQALTAFDYSEQKNLSKYKTDKALVRHLVDEFFDSAGISGTPIKAEELQKEMEQVGLEPNELSRDLIKAREE